MTQQNGRKRGRPRAAQTPTGTIRLRAKPLDQVDEEKLMLAFWMLAKKIVEDRTSGEELTREAVVAEARKLDKEDGDSGEASQ